MAGWGERKDGAWARYGEQRSGEARQWSPRWSPVSLSVGAGLPSAAPDDARACGHGAGNSCLGYRLVAGAAELGGSVADRGACNNAVRAARYAFAARFLVHVRAAPRPPVSIRRRRRAATGTVRREPIETGGRGVPRYAFAARFLVHVRAAPRPPVSIRRRRRAATGTVRREPIETGGRGVAALRFCCAFPRARVRAAPRPPVSIRRRRRAAALRFCCAFPRAREGGASATGFDPAAPARSYGDCSARADRNRWPRGGCGVCALWHFRLGDRALIRGRAGAERRAANSWSPMLADGEARRRFLFGTWRSAVAELVGNSGSQQLAAGQPSDVLARCWIWNRPSATAP